MTQAMTDAQLLSWAWQNECDGWVALGQVPGSPYRVERDGPVTCAWWEGGAGAMDNYVMLADDFSGDLGQVVAGLADRMRSSRSKTAIKGVSSTELRRQAEQLGWLLSSDAPALVCDRKSGRRSVPVPPEITVRRVETGADYAETFEVVHSVYGGPRSLTRFFNPLGPVHLYTGFWDGTPAASSTTWPFAGVAGIYSVATLPDYRRRGLALAVIQRQLDDAAADGMDLASLRTVDELIPFYGHLGFRLVGRFDQFGQPKE